MREKVSTTPIESGNGPSEETEPRGYGRVGLGPLLQFAVVCAPSPF